MDVREKIREYEKQRDFCLKIRCVLVAAKYQRWIDKLKKDYGIA